MRSRYEILHSIGQGAHGTVFLARPVRPNPPLVAIKRIPRRHDGKVEQEIGVLRILAGEPGVVQLLAVSEDDDYHYLVQEYLPGIDSNEWIRMVRADTRVLDETQLRIRFRAAAQGLEACHRRGVLHGDLKAANVRFSELSQRPSVLLDFGAARKTRRVRSKIEGTPMYYSPEKLRYDWGAAADVWAMGILLYQWVSGYHPFISEADPPEGLIELTEIVHRTPLNFNGPGWDRVSSSCRQLLLAMLEKNERNRIDIFQVLSHPWLRI